MPRRSKNIPVPVFSARLTTAYKMGLTPLLTVAIKKSIEENIFQVSAKIASVIPLDKSKLNKNEISNYRPVSVLNTFSKFYESLRNN